MGLYDGIKDIAKVMQQADNIDLYRRLLDLSAQALDLQAEVAKLREENAELKRMKSVEAEIEYHVDAYVTKHSDCQPIKYCAACWVDKKKLVPLQSYGGGVYRCTLCKAQVINQGEE